MVPPARLTPQLTRKETASTLSQPFDAVKVTRFVVQRYRVVAMVNIFASESKLADESVQSRT
jgi:hypothetical protein